MKPKSILFTHSKPGTPRRRRCRWLDDRRVERAMVMSRNILHQMKFMNRGERVASMLALQDQAWGGKARP